MAIELREISAATVRQITALQVAEEQRKFVATNAESLAEALFSPEAWYRAICDDDRPVGFVMLHDETLRSNPPEHPAIDLWRFMIDERHQGRRYGVAAMTLVIDHVRSRGVQELRTSYVPGPGCPEPFYRRLGFTPTGEVDEGEIVLVLRL